MGNNESKLLETNPLPLNDVLATIHNSLLKWIVTLSGSIIVFVGIFLVTKAKTDANPELYPELSFICGSYNKEILGTTLFDILVFSGVVLLVLLLLIIGKKTTEKAIIKKQLEWFMFISILLINVYIFLTGGFLDSPLSSALSIYVGSFLIMQDRDDTKWLNISLILWTIILVCLPYVVVYWFSAAQLSFLKWTEVKDITFARYWVAFLITGVSIYHADKINKKINKKYSSIT